MERCSEDEARRLVALRDQTNTARQPGSAIDKFSFVGSPYDDRSNVVYYVDDVVIQNCVAGGLFADGFEPGDFSRWSLTGN